MTASPMLAKSAGQEPKTLLIGAMVVLSLMLALTAVLLIIVPTPGGITGLIMMDLLVGLTVWYLYERAMKGNMQESICPVCGQKIVTMLPENNLITNCHSCQTKVVLYSPGGVRRI